MADNNSKDDRQGREVLDTRLVRLLDKDDILALDIYTASLLGDYQVVRDHLSAGFDVNRSNHSGWTPLIYSAYVGKDTVLNLLLEAGARVDATVPNTGMTAMMYAASCGNESVVYFLLQQNSNKNEQDKKGRTSLFHAASRGNVNVVKLLLDHNADMEIRDFEKGNTPLLETAAEGYEVICSLLLEHGASTKVKNKDGHTPQALAELYGNTMITDLLEQRTRGRGAVSLRSEAWLGEGSNDKLQFQDIKSQEVSTMVKNGIGFNTGFNSFPPKFGSVSAGCPSDDNPRGKIHLVPPRSRDIVAPINPADHELPGGSFYSVDSTGGHSFGAYKGTHERTESEAQFNDNFSSKKVFSAEKGEGKDKRGRRSPNPSKTSRVYTDVPAVSVLDHIEDKGVSTIVQLLEEIKLIKYAPCFEDLGMDLDTFLKLTDEKLKEIGVDKLGPRKKIISAIQRYNNDRKSKNFIQNDPHPVQSQHSTDTAGQLQQARKLIGRLETQLYKEQLARTEMEAYFVSEQGRLTRLMHLAVEARRDCEAAVKTLATAQLLQSDISARLNVLKEENRLEQIFSTEHTKQNITDVQRSLEGQLVSLNTDLTVALKQVKEIFQVLQTESFSD